MKRQKAAAHENHERWLVSYADFITLLFAFFVVMFATSQSDKHKAKAVSDSVRDALENGQFSNAISNVLGHAKHDPSKPPAKADPAAAEAPVAAAGQAGKQAAPDLNRPFAELKSGLAAELKAGKIGLSLESRGLVVSLRESAFFGSGDDAISAGSLPMLAKIAAVVRSLPNPVRLEGHTDSVPIHTSRFHSNWELSAARAIAMLELLREKYAVAAERIVIAGYAENAPTDTNETEQGRAHNRRVDLVVLSAEAEKGEPRMTPPPNPAPPAAHSPRE